jgi:hypothetical protein
MIVTLKKLEGSHNFMSSWIVMIFCHKTTCMLAVNTDDKDVVELIALPSAAVRVRQSPSIVE